MHATEKYTVTKPNWFVIEFCELGFIGKLFRAKDLNTLINYFLLFYKYKPVDWLIEDILRNMKCSSLISTIQCEALMKTIKVRHVPSLFQHIGGYSSLEGNIQHLKDQSFNLQNEYFSL